MDKQAVRRTLDQLAAFLELQGGNAARVRAVRHAARSELLATGRSSALDELREQVSPGLAEMLRIPGLGAAKVRRIHESLAIESLAELEAAAGDGRLAALPRFGAKTAESVRRGIASLRQASGPRLFHHAQDELEAVRSALAGLEGSGLLRVEIAGAVRRRCEVIEALDLVAVHEGQAARDTLVPRLGRAYGVTEIAGRGGNVTLRFASGTVVDVLLTTPERFGLDWIRATGSPAHVAALETRARAMGVSLSASFVDEPAVYRALDHAWVPPELREGSGELEAAANGGLPSLVEQGDLRGLLHCHSNYSDGTVTIADWAAACRAAGYAWVGITDHSKSSPYAGGLATEDVAQQHHEIDQVNARVSGVRVLKGVEADILADGTLDYGPDVLDRFDFVIGSIHSRRRGVSRVRAGAAGRGGLMPTKTKAPPSRRSSHETEAERRARVRKIIARLEKAYPDATCALHHKSALELLVATILSAQSTDARVNLVTPALFAKYRAAQDYAGTDPKVLEQEIHSTGFFRNKTKSIIGMAQALIERHGGTVPDTMEQLVQLPGVGRKTANVVLGTWFGKNEGIVVDTHVQRPAPAPRAGVRGAAHQRVGGGAAPTARLYGADRRRQDRRGRPAGRRVGWQGPLRADPRRHGRAPSRRSERRPLPLAVRGQDARLWPRRARSDRARGGAPAARGVPPGEREARVPAGRGDLERCRGDDSGWGPGRPHGGRGVRHPSLE